MPYQVTGIEICAEGMERLRNRSEFILCACACGPGDASAVLVALADDIDSVMREDGFDYDAAERALSEWADGGGREWLDSILSDIPWDEWKPEGPDSDSGECIPVFCYIDTGESD